MAREKVQDKYRAILDAAISVFADRGFWDTPTSLISKTAGVADGTLFNYFKTKDDLINEVYLDIKRDLIRDLMDGFDANATFQDRMRHIWNRYTEWGVNAPECFKVLQQIETSYPVPADVKAQVSQPLGEIDQLAHEAIARGELHNYPTDYMAALLENQAYLTVRFASADRSKLAEYQRIGFDILWHGVAG